MKRRPTRRTALLAGLVLAAGLRGASADDPTAPPPKPSVPRVDPVAKGRLDALRAKASSWLDARQGLLIDCIKCNGTGNVFVYRARNLVKQTCPKCEGSGRAFSEMYWRRLHFDCLSPDRRATLKIEDVKALMQETKVTAADTGALVKYRIESADLVGARFGRVFVLENQEPKSRESRWVYALDPETKRESWFVFSPETDGPWELPEEPVTAASKIEPLKAGDSDALRAKIGFSKMRHGFDGAQREDGTLIVFLFDPKASSAESLDAEISEDAVPAMRAALEAVADVTAVRLQFVARWRDKFGAVTKKPYKTAHVDRETFGKIHFENLTRDEVLTLFELKETLYPGEVMWWKDAEAPTPR